MVVKLDDPKDTYAHATAAPLTRVVLEQVLAARTEALDHTRLSRSAPPEPADLAAGQERAAFTFVWPVAEAADSLQEVVVPDVVGLSLRSVARLLHQKGLRMQLSGWGVVARTDPRAGTVVTKGTVVRVVGDVETRRSR